MALYYNVLFSILYGLINIFLLRWKVGSRRWMAYLVIMLPSLQLLNYGGWRLELFTPYFFAIWCVAEAGRLYNGYIGNLQEKVGGF